MNDEYQRDDPGSSPSDDPPARATYPRGVVPVLAIALVVALLTNVVLAGRLQGERAAVARLERSVATQQEALDALRGGLAVDEDGPLARIVAAVERIRGLEFERAVEPELLTSAQLGERVREAFASEADREEFEANVKVLAAFGLVDPGLDLYEQIAAAQEEQIGGYYDTEERVMVIEARNAREPTPLDQIILSHEYTHALTDQHHRLDRLDELEEARADDEATAFLALVEGDAQLVSELYVRSVLTVDEQGRLFGEIGEIETEQFDVLPPFLQEVFEFPYTRGLEFVRALHRRGGFEAVDDAYRDPPTSTEQILHPSKYVDDRDDPVTVELPDLAGRLGAGWAEIDAGGVGELDVLVIADHGAQSFSRADARAAADGWDGGAYRAYESSDGVVVAALTAWDTESEAREASQLFGRWLPLRFRNIGSSFDAGPGNKGWESPDGAGVVLRDGDRMLVVIGPDRATVERAATAVPGF